MQNFELCRRRGFKGFDTEAAAKLRLPKQHPPTGKDRGARYRSVKEKLKNKAPTKKTKLQQSTNKHEDDVIDGGGVGGGPRSLDPRLRLRAFI